MPSSSQQQHDDPKRMVTLVCDEHQIQIPETLARYSKTISALLDSNEGQQDVTFSFPAGLASIKLVEEIVRYMRYRREYDGKLDAPKYDIDHNVLRDLTLLADYLDI